MVRTRYRLQREKHTEPLSVITNKSLSFYNVDMDLYMYKHVSTSFGVFMFAIVTNNVSSVKTSNHVALSIYVRRKNPYNRSARKRWTKQNTLYHTAGTQSVDGDRERT